jgi:hypothetical protein
MFTFTSWLGGSSRNLGRRPKPGRRGRLAVETLEDRTVPSADWVVGPIPDPDPPTPPPVVTPTPPPVPPTVAALGVAYDVATNQDLKATPGVGLLNDLATPTNHLFQVTSITVNGQTVSPGQTAVTPSGGQLTVAADGSFTYTPATDFVGVESVDFAAAQGSLTEAGWATFSVGAGNPVAGPIAFTTAGTLEYDLIDAEVENALTINPVPYAVTVTAVAAPVGANFVGPVAVNLAAQLVVFAVFNVRLPNVRLDTRVRILPPLIQPLVRSELGNFTFFGALETMRQIARVRTSLEAANAWLTAEALLFPVISPSTSRWFVNNAAAFDYATVLTGFRDVKDGLDNNRTSYYDDPDSTIYGYVTGIPGDWDVYVGQKYWTGAAGANLGKERFGTIIHELSHFYAGTADWGYFNNPGALNGLAIVWDDPDNPGVAVVLTTAQLMANADSYAGYLTQYYYYW